MSPSLPDQPDLEHLRKQAKTWLEDAEHGNPEALARLRTVPRLAALDDQAIAAQAQLADAQHALALFYESESWPKLKARVEAGVPLAEQAERFLERVRAQDVAGALRWLERTPAIAGVNAFTACAAGDEATLARLLAADSAQAMASHAEHSWAPLLYVCASPLPADSPALANIARALLSAGADSNTWAPQPDDPKFQLAALYYACVRDHVGVVRALLERGARTQDGESIYHAAELDHRRCLEAMLEHGADMSGTQRPFGNTPLYFLAGYAEANGAAARAQSGMRWLLEHGADPNVPSGPSNETPLHQVARVRAGLPIAEALLAHGANPSAVNAAGRTPYSEAYRRADSALCKLLLAHGAEPRLTATDRFLGAALRGDEAAARAELTVDPQLLVRLDEQDRSVLTRSIVHEGGASIALLVALGVDLAWEAEGGGTALHWAAWHGRSPIVRQLVEAGAPLNVRDKTYGSSPLAWSAHGSRWCRSADDDYLAIAQLLLERGAQRPESLNRWGELPENLASPRVAAFFRRWYREHARAD